MILKETKKVYTYSPSSLIVTRYLVMIDFPVFLNKWIIGLNSIKHTPFWYWYRLINHTGYRMDDYTRSQDFWWSINGEVYPPPLSL